VAITAIGMAGCKEGTAEEKGKIKQSRRCKMLILKHVEYEIKDNKQLEDLLAHIRKTASQIGGVVFKDIYFLKGKKEIVLFLECESEKKYLEWREICPPPPGAKDWHVILLSKDEYFSK
jgi:hypothetical protein